MILDDIVAHKQQSLQLKKEETPLEALKEASRGAREPLSLIDALTKGKEAIHIIAELKKASPSAGVIREDFSPVEFACSYESAGASAISVLTEEHFFQGSLEILQEVKKAVGIPVLLKDFVIDEYQIYEARAAGADALLLIAAILDTHTLTQLYTLSRDMGMDVLFEVFDETDVLKAIPLKPRIVGINNRNLKTFKVDLTHTANLKAMIRFPYECLVSESGINSKEDIRYLKGIGVNAILVGETLMRYPDPGDGVKALIE